MPTTILPVSAIRSVRLTCVHCGAAVISPLGAKDAPSQCFNCGTRLPGPELVRGLVRELKWLHDQARQPGAEARVDFDVALEHDPQVNTDCLKP